MNFFIFSSFIINAPENSKSLWPNFAWSKLTGGSKDVAVENIGWIQAFPKFANWPPFGYMWNPNYSITHRLLRSIREIGETLAEIRSSAIPKSRFSTLIVEARALSTYASTSIEGNPLRLTDVKRLLKLFRE